MSDFDLNLSRNFEDDAHLTRAELADHIKLMAALKMFELGKLAAGKAAELAGLSKGDFLDACKRYKVSAYNYSDDEVADEIANDVETLKNRLNK